MESSQEFFFPITIRSGKGYGRNLSECYLRIHQALSRYSNSDIGISLPEWSTADEKGKPTIGTIILMVSHDPGRLALVRESVVGISESVARVYPVSPVPCGQPRALFRRDRMRQKFFRQLRLAKSSPEERERALERLESLGKKPSINVTSKTTGKNFSFEISMIWLDNREDQEKFKSFSSYGLSRGNNPQSVPVFHPF